MAQPLQFWLRCPIGNFKCVKIVIRFLLILTPQKYGTCEPEMTQILCQIILTDSPNSAREGLFWHFLFKTVKIFFSRKLHYLGFEVSIL